MLLWRANLILLFAVTAIAQTSPKPLAFEVASIKPSPPPTPGTHRDRSTPTGIDFAGATLRYCVGFAYRVKDYQISAPAWLDDLRFDITAKAPAGSRPSPTQIDEMLQTLLKERFNLRIHRETNEIPGLALIVAKGGLKLTVSTAQPGSPPARALPQADAPKPATLIDAMSVPIPGVVRTIMLPDGGVRLVAGDAEMSSIAGNVGNLLGTPVFDRTGATGRYDVVLDASRDDARNGNAIRCMGPECPQNGSAASATPGLSIYDSLQKVGLKLESTKAPVEIIVVDSVDRTPSEN